ncbi:hypothetical protein TNCV_557751 [Trichonephila clavipes]|nr:hypothetical protein TNCV_557751 [Trichonephila clavipes]
MKECQLKRKTWYDRYCGTEILEGSVVMVRALNLVRLSPSRGRARHLKTLIYQEEGTAVLSIMQTCCRKAVSSETRASKPGCSAVLTTKREMYLYPDKQQQ